LRLADQQARRTGLASDIARRDRLEDLARADQAKLAEMKNQAANVGVQAATTLTANDKSTLTQKYGIDVSAKTSRYVADLQAQTSREYTAALKEQQIEASKAKILVDAAGDYIAKNAANPKYLKDPAQLQNDAVAYANSIGAQFGVLPRGASSAPPMKPTQKDYENKYGLPPTNLR